MKCVGVKTGAEICWMRLCLFGHIVSGFVALSIDRTPKRLDLGGGLAF